MIDYQELVKRLREPDRNALYNAKLRYEAAEAIEYQIYHSQAHQSVSIRVCAEKKTLLKQIEAQARRIEELEAQTQ